MPAVFLTNDMLQNWSDQGKVRLEGTVLTLIAEKRTVALNPAVRFTSLIDGSDDVNKLLGKVKTTAQLIELGAEHYLDSVIYGDVGYTVVEGFLGDLSPAKRAPKASPPPTADLAVDDDAGDFHERTDVRLVDTGSQTAAPAAVDLPPAPNKLSEAEALSQLFLSTVPDIKRS
jgi:hypothetical protein